MELSAIFVVVAIKIWLLRSHGLALELAELQTQLDSFAIASATAEAAPTNSPSLYGHAITPLRHYADTPTRRHADTPTRRHADTPTRPLSPRIKHITQAVTKKIQG
jgi:hypothetical protein